MQRKKKPKLWASQSFEDSVNFCNCDLLVGSKRQCSQTVQYIEEAVRPLVYDSGRLLLVPISTASANAPKHKGPK